MSEYLLKLRLKILSMMYRYNGGGGGSLIEYSCTHAYASYNCIQKGGGDK